MVEPIDGTDWHLIDTEMMGVPAALGVYVVDGDRPTILDAGTAGSADRILAGLDALGIARDAVDRIVVTHVHIDHVGGAPALLSACPEATVACPAETVPTLTDPGKMAEIADRFRRAMGADEEAYGRVETIPRDRIETVAPGDALDLGDRRLGIVEASGHVGHQVAVHDAADDALYAADEAGLSMMGELFPSTPPPEFDLERNLASLDRFADLDPSVLLYAHYGPRRDVDATLDRYGEVLRSFVDDVDAARGHHDDASGIVDALEGSWPSPTLRTDVLGVLAYLGDDRWRQYPGGRQQGEV